MILKDCSSHYYGGIEVGMVAKASEFGENFIEVIMFSQESTFFDPIFERKSIYIVPIKKKRKN